MTDTYDVGDLVRIGATFKDDDNQPADPTTVTFSFRQDTQTKAQATVYTYGLSVQLIKDGVGQYHVDLAISASGLWHYRWAGTGAIVGAEEGDFVVNISQFV